MGIKGRKMKDKECIIRLKTECWYCGQWYKVKEKDEKKCPNCGEDNRDIKQLQLFKKDDNL